MAGTTILSYGSIFFLSWRPWLGIFLHPQRDLKPLVTSNNASGTFITINWAVAAKPPIGCDYCRGFSCQPLIYRLGVIITPIDQAEQSNSDIHYSIIHYRDYES